jgi:hypothetical protein
VPTDRHGDEFQIAFGPLVSSEIVITPGGRTGSRVARSGAVPEVEGHRARRVSVIEDARRSRHERT